MEDFDNIIAQNKPTLVDFFATWCGPCQRQGPILDEVKAQVGESANIVKIDVDKNKRLAAQYNVRSVPTLIVFVAGEAVWRDSGLHTKDQIVAKLREFQK